MQLRWAAGVAATLCLLAGLAAAPPASAAGGNGPATATRVAAAPFSDVELSVPDPAPATGAANQLVSDACVDGEPIYGVRWWRFEPSRAQTVVARTRASTWVAHYPERAPSGLALVDAAATSVLQCDVGPASGDITQVGPTTVASGQRVYVVQFLQAPARCSDPCNSWSRELWVGPSSATPPPNDDRADAAPVAGLPYTSTADRTLATEEPDEMPAFPPTCSLGWDWSTLKRSVWWKFTPTTTAELDVTVNGFAVQRGHAGAWPSQLAVLIYRDGSLVDPCGPTLSTFEAGRTYRIQVAHPIGRDQADRIEDGGPATLDITAKGSPAAPTNLWVSTDADSGAVTVNWSPPASPGSSPVTGYRVTRDGTDAEGDGPETVAVPSSARSHTFAPLVEGETYTLAVRAINAVGAGRAASVTTALGGGSTYVPLNPARVLDTRTGTGAPRAAVGPGRTLRLQVTGPPGTGLAPQGSTAVVLNVTATNASAAGYVSVYPTGQANGPTTSSLNVAAGKTAGNLVVTKVADDGSVTLYNHLGTVDLVADLAGAYTAANTGSTYSPLDPSRVLDTRTGTGAPRGPVTAGRSITLQVTGPPGSGLAPVGSTAVVLNVTATNPSAGGYVSVYPSSNANGPSTSSLNFAAGQTVGNLVVTKVGSDGSVRVYNHAGTVDLVADLAGAYAATVSGSTYSPLEPGRILDTRNGTGAPRARIGAGRTLRLQVTGPPGSGLAPQGSTAVVLNVTATNVSAAGYVSVYPTGYAGGPATSSLNFTAGQTVPNLVVTKVAEDGSVTLYNHLGTVDLIADLHGAFTLNGAVA